MRANVNVGDSPEYLKKAVSVDQKSDCIFCRFRFLSTLAAKATVVLKGAWRDRTNSTMRVKKSILTKCHDNNKNQGQTVTLTLKLHKRHLRIALLLMKENNCSKTL